jgi:hypothetical protein
MKRFSAAVAQTADELLEKSYVGTAEQTLRGAETMTKVLHEEDPDIAKAKRTIANKPGARKTTKKRPERNISKRSARKTMRPKTGRKSGKR